MRGIISLKNKSTRTFVQILFYSFFLLSNFLYCTTLLGKEGEQDKVKQKKSSFILLPILFYTPETKIAGGLGCLYYFRTSDHKVKTRPSSIWMGLIYTQKKQFFIDFYPDLYLKKEVYHLTGNFSFRKFPDKFFGIGNNTTEDMEEHYTSQAFNLALCLQKKVRSKLYVGLQYEFEHSKIIKVENNGQLVKGEIEGSKGGTTSGMGAVINWDDRDSIIYPTRGIFCQLSANLFNQALGSDYNYNKFNLDFRQYSTLFFSHVLASQGYINIITGNPPFQKLSLLGGQNIFRGYYQGRYRDKNMIVFQTEYRMPIMWGFGLVGFVGIGDVADKMSNFKFGNFKYSIGLGIRYQISREEGTNLRLDFGFGKKSSGVYITLNEAF